MIEKVKRLHDEVQLSVLADFEELQDTKIKLHLCWILLALFLGFVFIANRPHVLLFLLIGNSFGR
jgi:hypothetical protein